MMDLEGHAQIVCSKCKSLVDIDTETRKVYIIKERQKKENASGRNVG